MAQMYLVRENNQRVSAFSHRWSNYAHDNPDILCKNYQALRNDYNDYHYDY